MTDLHQRCHPSFILPPFCPVTRLDYLSLIGGQPAVLGPCLWLPDDTQQLTTDLGSFSSGGGVSTSDRDIADCCIRNLYRKIDIQGGNRGLKRFFFNTGLHVLFKPMVALKSTGWCVQGCWLTIYSIETSFFLAMVYPAAEWAAGSADVFCH